jgi:hypothetical protein
MNGFAPEPIGSTICREQQIFDLKPRLYYRYQKKKIGHRTKRLKGPREGADERLKPNAITLSV